MIIDIGNLLDHGRWTTYQKLITVLTAIAVLFDGFDIQILGVAIPSIMREWNVPRSAFAAVLAMGMVGMAVASPLAGYVGDRIGRRTALVCCLLLFGAATVATAFSTNITELTVLRVLTGMGAGGALPNASALAAEFSPLRKRPTAVTFTIVCVPLGGMVAGLVAAWILPVLGWHTLYLIGGMAPLMVAVLLMGALPESPRFLARFPGRVEELIALLNQMGHRIAEGSRFEDASERKAEKTAPLKILIGREHLRDTIGLWLAFLSNLNGVYLVFGWLPAMLSAQGLSVATASSGLAAYNFGGVLGVLLWAPLVTMKGSRAPLLFAAIAGALSAASLQFIHGATMLVAGYGLHGLFANAVQTNLYALATHVYPTRIRASGVAASAAIGRGGAILSSVTGAAIIQAGSLTYLYVLAASMLCCTAGLAIVNHHFQKKPL